jgi:hypothetical protein
VPAVSKILFEGMTQDSVTLADLLKAREDFIADIVGELPEQHKRFLISVKRASLTGRSLACPPQRICRP